ncbi:protein dopey-1 homolog isoform X3 [Aethina tumida]|uniref:protein dopey-1 homolog isoform X3 n=1 Tax=Aethina tumida TaxID=116153 RepID=UPI00214902BC|nr:protein dopey-1 homolog isoform X3 [Aethina tumida]
MTTFENEEFDLMKDSKYRMYVAAVDKALKNFEYTSEWADLIAALTKLNKVLSSYTTKYSVIPRRIKISKRLAQCMHPALPSGVHLRALETYDLIFQSMGPDKLSRELFIYSAGLFPLMGHAAMNIRPTLLKIYETHFVSIKEKLRPALAGFLSGILPGLDTGSDHYDRTTVLLENVCEGVGPAYFYTCIWQCVANNSPVRLPAISYILAHYNRKFSMEDQLHLIGQDVGLMVSGLCAAVQDTSVLVQRSALDLLMVCFPMKTKQLLYADMVQLVTAALYTILRRDMSLNRRLYSWLLETDPNNPVPSELETEPQAAESVAYDLLIDSIRNILQKCCTELPLDIKPYRLLTTLFDKPQIGPVILDNILYDVFRTMYLSCLYQQKHKNSPSRCVSFNGDLKSLKPEDNTLNKVFVAKNCQELVKNANVLFNTLQSYYIWLYIEKLYEDSVKTIKTYKYRDRCQVNEIGSGPPHILEICILTDFLLDVIPVENYTKSTSNILPNLFTKIISTLRSNIKEVNQYEITQSLQLCLKILTKIQPISLADIPSDSAETKSISLPPEHLQNSLDGSTVEEKSEDDNRTLEKSKSDSKINENLEKNELTIDDNSRERSYSNQMLKNLRKEKTSPKIEKKAKNKKSKSSSKLYDLKKEDQSELTETAIPESKIQDIVETPLKMAQIENKYFIKCLEEYKNFYVDFIKSKVLPKVDVHEFFKKFLSEKNEDTKKLEKLLDKRLNNCLDIKFTVMQYVPRKPEFSMANISSEDSVCDYESSMTIASNILLEFSAFPNLLQASKEKRLPMWLITLIVASCCKESSRDVQITAMNTLLEIFSLAKNQNYQKSTNCTINITGFLENEHVVYIEENTTIIEEMSQILWNYIGILTNQTQLLLCVTLLYQIHNTFDSKLFVEQVISQYLSSDNISVGYVKQFLLLWHLGRDLNIKLSPHKSHIRNFDRSLLNILDNLQNKEKPNLQLLAESFLTHSLYHNDIARIINPILSKLLAANTARISIKYVNIHHSETQGENNIKNDDKTEDKQSKKIIAVSNINGNIMYHVTDGPSPKPPKKKWFGFPKSAKKFSPSVVETTTSFTEDSSIITRKNKDFKNISVSPKLEKSSKGVKVIINPLSSKEIYPNGLDGSYSRLSSQHSSTESLTSSNDCTPLSSEEPLLRSLPSDICNGDRDPAYDSIKSNAKTLWESMEPISEGIKTEKVNGSLNKIPKSHSFDEKSCQTKDENLESTLVHSWSYCISDSDNLNGELEISRSAEEFFKGDNSVVNEILNEIISKVCAEVDEGDEVDVPFRNLNRPTDLDLKSKTNSHISNKLYPIHSHICLYYDKFDSNQIIYALITLKNCILANPQLFIKCLSTSGIKNLKNNDILHLLARHHKYFKGGGYYGDLDQDYVNQYRGYMFLDVIIHICLNYARSFFAIIVEPEEIFNNLKIQLESLDILDIIISNLAKMVDDNSKGFSSYIADLMVKCNMREILLHCMLTSVRDFDKDMTFAEEVLLWNHFQLSGSNNRIGEHMEAFQIQILKVIKSLIILEHSVTSQKAVVSNGDQASVAGDQLNYAPHDLIPQQKIFLSSIRSALQNSNIKCLHEKWLNMISSCLPYFGESLTQLSITVIHLICNNIEQIAQNYGKSIIEDELCADYAVTQLESLTILCHYCLLDSSQTVNQNVPVNATTPVSNPGEIFNNLVNVFFSPLSVDANFSTKQNSDHYQAARKKILSHMPRIILSVAKLWQTVVSLEGEFNGIYGNSKFVKQQLLEFLSPISVNHGASFVAAIAVAWHERRNPFSGVKTVLPEPNAGQNNLVYLISAIRVIPLDNLVQTVTSVIKNPPQTEDCITDISLDVSVLELFYCYMRKASATQLSEAWSSLLALIREGCSLSPPAQFLLSALLHELMIKCCPLEERKDQKDLQDVTAKLIECVSQVCGSCLEQTTWLRRNLAVKEQEDESALEASIISGSSNDIAFVNNYSVQAQLVLSEILAPILDICFGSSEKDKVNTILTSLMYNIVPYLKNHTVRNMPSFYACSKLLASLSSYQYTRKAWKKDIFDLLLDNSLFQMDHQCLKFWRTIVDNLMTHDNTTFKDLMSRVTMTQSGSLNLFSSREQEYEQKAQLLKRLAYVIFCSEMDQYAKYMPDIQEQLTTSLRINVPNIQAQVFLCFRVILIRMSPIHVTSLWPIIISEMLQVFLQIEQELSKSSDEFRPVNNSWATNSSNGLHALGHPHYLRLQLSTAKLLDLALLLPATTLPQFQMYRWAFVGDDLDRLNQSNQISFTPHVHRIAELMEKRFTDTPIETLPLKRNELLLKMNTITQLKDLHGFFKTLSLCSNRHRTECSRVISNDYTLSDRQSDRKLDLILEKIDKVIEEDFLDRIPR